MDQMRSSEDFRGLKGIKKNKSLQRSLHGFWPTHDLSGARLFTEPTFSHYPMPMSIPLEPYTLSPIYSSPQSTYMPYYNGALRKKGNINSSLNISQDYMSLPPLYCDGISEKSSDTDGHSKRRFSDPGVSQPSQEEDYGSCSASLTNDENKVIVALKEEIKELKENNEELLKDFRKLQMRLDNLEAAQNQPGSLASYINELRAALKIRDDALTERVHGMILEASDQCKKVHASWEQSDGNLRLKSLEDKIAAFKLEVIEDQKCKCSNVHQENQSNVEALVFENKQLKEQLEITSSQLSDAEANKQKLDRLVGILRKKINELTAESASREINHPTTGIKPSPPPKPPSISLKPSSRTNIKINGDAVQLEKNGEAVITKPGNNGSPLAMGLTITGPVTDL